MQLDYTINQAVAILGQIADSSKIKDVESYKNPAAAVFYGRVVTRGAASDEVVHPAAGAGITDEKLVRGIVVAAHEVESKQDGAAPSYAQNSVVPVMRKGRIWVNAITAVTEGTSTVNVYFQGAGPIGGLRATADASDTAVLPKSKWKSSTTGANQLALLEIDL